MKNAIFVLVVSLFFTNCTTSQENTPYQKEIKQFQYKLNTHYANPKESPLTKEDIKTFKSLAFFDINPKYRVKARLELTPDAPIFKMKTTTSRMPLYKKYGIAHFTLDGKELSLSIYQNQDLMNSLEYENYLFLPFNDTTNGTSSYGGGRFIDLEIPESPTDSIIIDFNKAYNPYCAYNANYSCPIPPSENNLPVAIPAGVKAYGKHH
ncbi:DUF1684 domain-containing protein [Lutibacter sp.]